LWGTTFGWNHGQIDAFAQRLEADRHTEKLDRSVWFAGVEHDGLLVSAVMAERLTLPGNDGPIDLVESTEWATRKGHDGNGYTPTALAALNAQILGDLADSPNGRPLIFAECNFTNRADRTGSSVGMVIPSREYASQVLPQNVVVGDGQQPHGYRDFNLMVLPLKSQQAYYSPGQIDHILGMINSEVTT